MTAQRLTIQRKLVLDAVRSLQNHPTAEDIFVKITAEHPNVSRGTVYRNLALLAECGEIQRVSHLNAADRFDFNLTPHYHFRCRACNTVQDIAMPYSAALMAQAQDGSDYFIESCNINFTGLCASCQKSCPRTN